jgi:hypothetical protein
MVGKVLQNLSPGKSWQEIKVEIWVTDAQGTVMNLPVIYNI